MSTPLLPDPEHAPLAVIGLGYVGLPLAVAFGCKRPTVGFDTDVKRIDRLQAGIDATQQVTAAQLDAATCLQFSHDPALLRHCSIYIIAVPTPIDEQNTPNLTPLCEASRCIARLLKPGDLVIYESTVYPGTTEEICIPLLQTGSGLRCNHDFFCGYSPERINPGDKSRQLSDICKITSGSTANTAECVDALYRTIITAGTWLAPSIRVAEAAKVVENIQRDVNIALINELAMLFGQLDIDTQDVIDAAATKWNFSPFRPGLVGGHCIGVDPYYLLHKSHSIGFQPELIETARRVNTRVEQHILQRIIDLLTQRGRSLHGCRVLQLGITFKEDCPDLRNSRALRLARLLCDQGALVDLCDPCADLEEAASLMQMPVYRAPLSPPYHVIILAVAHATYCRFEAAHVRALAAEEAVVFDVKSVWPRTIVTARL